MEKKLNDFEKEINLNEIEEFREAKISLIESVEACKSFLKSLKFLQIAKTNFMENFVGTTTKNI